MTNLKSRLNTLAILCLLIFTANVISAQTPPIKNVEDNSDGISIKGKNISFYNSSNKFQAGLDATDAGLNFKARRADVTNLKFYNKRDVLLGGFQFREYSNPDTNYPYQGGLLDANGQYFLLNQTGGNMFFRAGDKTRMVVFADGRVGIGNVKATDENDNPIPRIQKQGGFGDDVDPKKYKLIVQTGILTEKVKVAGLETGDWADYVFEEDYEMLPIEELEDYVKENKHLPNVPSAEEVAENGLDLAKTDATLLEKIEESYLYIIELNKKFDALAAENNGLKDELKALKASQN